MNPTADDDDPLAVPAHFDPQSLPHDPVFALAEARGNAIVAGELRPLAIRQRFASPPPWRPELRADMRVLYPDRPPRVASVLIPLITHANQIGVLLTQRTAHLSDHAGQISFPGGRVEKGDVDAIATALRETKEEIGILPAQVDVIGTLPEYMTATGYNVTPVVGLIEPPFTAVLDPFEVSEVFEVPLAFLMDPANHERRVVQIGDAVRTFYAMPYAKPGAGVSGPRYFIWGATAAMLRNLYQFLRAERAGSASTIES
ncbi:MAG: CoA pyrophosphatase [Burkholderiaceae bacterium]